MVVSNTKTCPICGGELKYFDKVRRKIKFQNGRIKIIFIRRLRCIDCYKVHRELPNFIFPYKHYEAGIIRGVLEGTITPETLGYEDYPCEMTMKRWKSRK